MVVGHNFLFCLDVISKGLIESKYGRNWSYCNCLYDDNLNYKLFSVKFAPNKKQYTCIITLILALIPHSRHSHILLFFLPCQAKLDLYSSYLLIKSLLIGSF